MMPVAQMPRKPTPEKRLRIVRPQIIAKRKKSPTVLRNLDIRFCVPDSTGFNVELEISHSVMFLDEKKKSGPD
jgi:hypothetical protein